MNGTVLYCGPALPKKGLFAHALFTDGLPPHVESLARQCPEIMRLMAPAARAAEVMRRAKRPGTEEHRLYQAIRKHTWE